MWKECLLWPGVGSDAGTRMGDCEIEILIKVVV